MPEAKEDDEVVVKTRAGGFLEEVLLFDLPLPVLLVRLAAAECNAGFNMMVLEPGPPVAAAAAEVCCISKADSVVSRGSDVVFNFLICYEKNDDPRGKFIKDATKKFTFLTSFLVFLNLKVFLLPALCL